VASTEAPELDTFAAAFRSLAKSAAESYSQPFRSIRLMYVKSASLSLEEFEWPTKLFEGFLRVLSILPGNDSVNPGTVRRGDGRQVRSFWSGQISCRMRTTLGIGREAGKKLPNAICQTKGFIRAKERIVKFSPPQNTGNEKTSFCHNLVDINS